MHHILPDEMLSETPNYCLQFSLLSFFCTVQSNLSLCISIYAGSLFIQRKWMLSRMLFTVEKMMRASTYVHVALYSIHSVRKLKSESSGYVPVSKSTVRREKCPTRLRDASLGESALGSSESKLIEATFIWQHTADWKREKEKVKERSAKQTWYVVTGESIWL